MNSNETIESVANFRRVQRAFASNAIDENRRRLADFPPAVVNADEDFAECDEACSKLTAFTRDEIGTAQRINSESVCIIAHRYAQNESR